MEEYGHGTSCRRALSSCSLALAAAKDSVARTSKGPSRSFQLSSPRLRVRTLGERYPQARFARWQGPGRSGETLAADDPAGQLGHDWWMDPGVLLLATDDMYTDDCVCIALPLPLPLPPPSLVTRTLSEGLNSRLTPSHESQRHSTSPSVSLSLATTLACGALSHSLYSGNYILDWTHLLDSNHTPGSVPVSFD